MNTSLTDLTRVPPAAVDLNCDMGEGAGNDPLIMPYITSVNIACGYHAGDSHTIRDTVRLAKQYRAAIGAHVSFYDRENFGRVNMLLPVDEIYTLVKDQVRLLQQAAQEEGLLLSHVKPHGALYNMSAADEGIAKAIAHAVKDTDGQLVLFGLSGSCSITVAEDIGLKTASEVFADRRYMDDGTLAPRTYAGALIEDRDDALEQVLQMLQQGTVLSVNGREVAVKADTICIHGDAPDAAGFAKTIAEQLQAHHIRVTAFYKR